MSIDEVIRAGNFNLPDITFLQIALSSEPLTVAINMIVVIAILYGGLCIVSHVIEGKINFYPITLIALFFVLIGGINFLTVIVQKEKELKISNPIAYEKKVEHWMTSQVIPLINAFPTQKITVRPLKISPIESSTLPNSSKVSIRNDLHLVRNQLNILNSTAPVSNRISKVIVMYKVQDQIMTETQYMQIRSLPSSSSSSPYMTYQLLTNDLGHDVAKGKYNTTLYLPSDYVFEQ